MWIRPSMSPSRLTKAPKLAILATVPLTRSPTLKRPSMSAPRIVVELLDAERDALVRLVDRQHDRLDFVALLEDFARVVDLARPADRSETWIMPSMPSSSSTKAP